MSLLDKIERSIKSKHYELYQCLDFLGNTASALLEALRHPFKIRWRETFYYLEQCGVKSLPIVLIICFLLGTILAFQGALQLAQFGTQIFIVDLVGWSVLMELGPVMVAIIATGRAGSAFAAEIGTMIVDEEVNALNTMGISVARFLVIPKLIALSVAMPLLTCFGNIAALLGGLCIGVTVGDVPMAAYITRTFNVLTPDAFLFGVGKSLIFAIIIALVGCFRGLQSSMDAQGVGRSATNAVVTSIFAVVISDAIITILNSLT